MENNKHTNYSSRCRKIRQALANSSAVRAIHRISYYHQESSRPSNSPLPKPVKVSNGEAHGSIPIKFDYSTPTSSYIGHAQVGKVATRVEPEPPQQHYVYRNATSTFKGGEDKGKLKAQDYFDQQYEKKDMNYMFSEYIQRAREKLRTVSNIGKGQSKPAPNEVYNYNNNNNNVKKDNHRDQISDFIQITKKKIRTTSSMGRTSSLNRG